MAGLPPQDEDELVSKRDYTVIHVSLFSLQCVGTVNITPVHSTHCDSAPIAASSL
jgi:hypothetical protein